MTPLPQRTTRLAKDLLDVAAVPKGEVERLLTLAAALKKKQRRGIAHALAQGENPRAPVSKAVNADESIV